MDGVSSSWVDEGWYSRQSKHVNEDDLEYEGKAEGQCQGKTSNKGEQESGGVLQRNNW